MEWVKTTAKTVPQAIEQALDTLGVDESEAEIVIIEEPRKGLFGRMKGTARVEARIKPVSVRPKADRRNRRGDRKGGRGKGNGRGRSDKRGDRNRGGSSKSSNRNGNSGGKNTSDKNTAGKNTGDRNESGKRDSNRGDQSQTRSKSNRSRGGKNDQSNDKTKVDAQSGSGSGRDSAENNGGRSNDRQARGEQGQGSSGRRRNRRGGGEGDSQTSVVDGADESTVKRSRAGKTAAVAGTAAVGAGAAKRSNKSQRKNPNRSDADSKPTEEKPVEHVADEVVADHLKNFLGGLTTAFGLEGAVAIENPEPEIMVATVDGQHGLMVGPKGRTLDAIQELARVSAQRSAPSAIRIRVDVGGYRKQRTEAIASFAVKAADKAVDNGVEVKLDPMPASDRKAVHDALTEDARVETRSIGAEPRRRVLIVPVAGGDASDDQAEEE